MKDKINTYLRKFGMEVHGVGYIQKLKNSELKKSEWLKQKELLKGRANVIFDIGANKGDSVSKYLEIFPASTIHCFEPFPDSIEKFKAKHKKSVNVILNEYALSSYVGKSILNVNKSVDTNSMLESRKIGASSDKSCTTTGKIEIDTNTIDSYCMLNNISEIDIIKIDVQGSEIEVLKGGGEMLKKGGVKVIFIETYFEQQYVNQPLFHDISKMLYEFNFVIQDMYDPYYSLNTLLWCDSIFVSRKII